MNRSRRALLLIAVVVLAVGALFLVFRSGTDATARVGNYSIGAPGPGGAAPDFTLPSAAGDQVRLADYRGKTVLLFFHEGLGCQPCWDQIRDLEAQQGKLDAAGVDELVTITTAPVDLLAQKMADDGLSSVALSDSDLSVSETYGANQFGMMGDSRDGHSFLLVGPDGTIEWRADYGGSPDYTMYVPVEEILADLAAGRVAG